MTTTILLEQLRQRLDRVQQRIERYQAVAFGDSDWQAASGALIELRCEQLWLASLIDDLATLHYPTWPAALYWVDLGFDVVAVSSRYCREVTNDG